MKKMHKIHKNGGFRKFFVFFCFVVSGEVSGGVFWGSDGVLYFVGGGGDRKLRVVLGRFLLTVEAFVTLTVVALVPTVGLRVPEGKQKSSSASQKSFNFK